MTNQEILSHVDHTLLKAVSTWDEIQKICEEALENHTASVCVPPSYIKRIADTYGNKINICTVIGFPLGYNTTAVKVFEVQQAIADGAGEVDMVVNIGDVKNGDFDKVTKEIEALKKAAGDHVLKVIIETCYLTEEEKIRLCQCVTDGGADYIKTSTGFGTAGAKIEDVRLFKQYIGPNVKIKAAGGVKTKADLELFLEEGCDRIGTSSALMLLKGEAAGQY
ncbi:deoxyribose-phosphate aldolase [Clostridium sp. AM58-1XD]|uniref:deoxyribose-phosphate aldolase n=1 Tax=Clostridium sp. AM58-1XD TaxID=2292307 RepID=UPI000E4C3F24|nr:deoxyribose-phosphate aldolase [Clostridium sp. AM58-1XD]RGY99286.1 deoxyribose-phosphate aldolase [Clostridium sp. AM58-1XD]